MFGKILVAAIVFFFLLTMLAEGTQNHAAGMAFAGVWVSLIGIALARKFVLWLGR